MTTSAARWRSLLVHGLRRGDRRARVCGCVTHMKTDDGSGADVRSQPPRDGKFMRSATAEKWGAGGGYITYKSHASSVRRNRFECRSTPSVTPRPRALYGSYVTRQLSYVGYTGDRARTAPSPPATATFVIGIVRAIGFGSESPRGSPRARRPGRSVLRCSKTYV